jgi:hypothetical protein
MNRVYGEPVEVRTGEDGHRPARFAWRGRSYTVGSVMEHWVVNKEWWREPDPAAAHPELEFWRVEAWSGHNRGKSHSQGQGQGQNAGTYELRRDVAADAWTLRLIAD